MPIPTCHSGETSQDDSVHKVYISCSTFIGKNNNGINQLLRDSFHEIYDKLFDIVVEAIDIPEDCYTSIANAAEVAGEGYTAEMDPFPAHFRCVSRKNERKNPLQMRACRGHQLVVRCIDLFLNPKVGGRN